MLDGRAVGAPGQLESPALGSPNPWDEANHARPSRAAETVGETRPLSPAMQSVLLLTALYYLLYMIPIVERFASLGLSCCVRKGGCGPAEAEGGESTPPPPTVLQRICKNAENAMQLIPMLSILILLADFAHGRSGRLQPAAVCPVGVLCVDGDYLRNCLISRHLFAGTCIVLRGH